MSVKIKNIPEHSLFLAHKIRQGDLLVSINNNAINDFLDYYFHSSAPAAKQNIYLFQTANGEQKKIKVNYNDTFDALIELEDFNVLRCGNKCVFCFCDQHPCSARSALFFKDEDFRLSFLYGNYITLSNLKESDYKKIIELKLSPLYISIHSTNDVIRRKMLGINYKFRILDKLNFFVDNKINMHLQIVLIPDYNFDDLENTLNELINLYPAVLSIAVVPVGLTKYRKNLQPLKKINKLQAQKIIDTINVFQDKCFNRFGAHIVYAADEFYFIAGKKTPAYETYDDFEQLENGVGMTAKFLFEFKTKLKYYSRKFDRNKKFIIITGKITEKLFIDIADLLNKNFGMNIIVQPIKNKYFGETVTVTGLIAGKDLIAALTELKNKKIINKNTVVLAPDNILRYNRDLFIDDIKFNEVSQKFPIKFIEPTATALLKNL